MATWYVTIQEIMIHALVTRTVDDSTWSSNCTRRMRWSSCRINFLVQPSHFRRCTCSVCGAGSHSYTRLVAANCARSSFTVSFSSSYRYIEPSNFIISCFTSSNLEGRLANARHDIKIHIGCIRQYWVRLTVFRDEWSTIAMYRSWMWADDSRDAESKSGQAILRELS